MHYHEIFTNQTEQTQGDVLQPSSFKSLFFIFHFLSNHYFQILNQIEFEGSNWIYKNIQYGMQYIYIYIYISNTSVLIFPDTCFYN